MIKHTQDALIQLLLDSLQGAGAKLSAKEVFLDIPQDTRFGDLSTNLALQLTKTLKKPPRQIAESIVSQLNGRLADSSLSGQIKEIKIEGPGFINFYFKEAYFYEQIKSLIKTGEDYFRVDIGKGKRALVEFVSANPTGPLSVAHARQAAVGDALANIMAFLGYAVQREYYLNDEGNQINILGNSVSLRLKELHGEKIDFPEDHYQGDYICDIAKEILESDRKISDLKEFAANHILAIIKKELDDFGVHFDCWYSQKELQKSGKIEDMLAQLKQKGFVYDQDGAVWFKSTSFGDDKDRVLIKSDGSYTYVTPDIAYHQEKYKRGFNWLINLWGPDHHGYISRIKASVEAFGHDPATLAVIIVQLATIFRDGKPVQMSTRRGQYITLREVLDEVGRDASRYFFVMRRTSSHLDFDLEVAKKQTQENPAYYVQYAHARICSILRSSEIKIDAGDADVSMLVEKEELALMKKLCQFFYILNVCLTTLDPYMLTVYLSSVAEDFHKFYDAHRVLGQDEKLTRSRLCLLYASRIVISSGLQLLGVSCPEKM